jgi:hypothetical protein
MGDFGETFYWIFSGYLRVNILGDQLEGVVARQLVVSCSIDLSNPRTKGFKLQGVCLLILLT